MAGGVNLQYGAYSARRNIHGQTVQMFDDVVTALLAGMVLGDLGRNSLSED